MSAHDPRRWLESDGLDEALRDDLEAAAKDDVDYDVGAGVARFEAWLARGGPPGDGGGEAGSAGTGGGAAAAGGSAASKGLALVVGLAVIVGGGAIAWSVADGGPRAASAPAEHGEPSLVAGEPAATTQAPAGIEARADAHAGADAPSPADASAQAAPSPEPDARPDADADAPPRPDPALAAPEPPRPRSGRTKPRSPTATADPQPPTDDDRLRREMQATDRARRALDRDPSRALALVREAETQFPDGLFAEDREGIAILALLALDRTAEARPRAEAFLRAHPRSSHADRIRAAMTGPEKP